ncbi:energy-coupling factor ABC transporter ATP-binding protein [Methanoregula sp.]|jgi:cobalt/nickel transport system ATP-binding protein|uniref:energy-coupling factor ABC transporter ATP-binding protein n=1 Tax=Methanoregula sp. TaxID=2052170 RepID=UPI0025FD4297|nr:ATP-binding cassette domain-containing protein [Methanoregula sp.]
MTNLLEFDNIHYAYPSCPESLSGVTFSIKKGAKVALVGPNGAGKTTLMLMCNGVLEPSKGRVLLDGEPLRYDSRSLREVRKKVGMVFQNSDTQLFAPTVYQDVAFGPLNLGMEPDEIEKVVSRALLEVGLAGFEKRPPHQLSGGEKKRAAIAGTLAMDPEVLVFDEPTSSLDPAGAADLMELLDELHAKGATIIISTHDVELAYLWADQIILVNKGTVIHAGTPEEVFTDPALVTSSNLRMPAVLEVYTELVSRQMVEKTQSPKSVLQLVSSLEQSSGKPKAYRAPGTITVCNVDTTGAEEIKAWVADNPGHKHGAMGTRAKDLAERESIALDFTYGVIDKGILRALVGECSVLLTPASMVPHVFRRVETYCRESGNSIAVVPMNTKTQSPAPGAMTKRGPTE